MARSGMLRLAMEHMFRNTASASRGRVGVHRGQRTLVTRVHRLQHVKSFLATDLANHNPSGRIRRLLMTSCRCRTAPLPSMFRRPGLEADHVLLLQLQFSGIFDGNNAVGVWDISRKDIQQRGFAGAGSTEIRKFSRPLTMADNSSSMGSVRLLFSIMLRAVTGSRRNGGSRGRGRR